MGTRIQIRRDTYANWTANNPIPADGELCWEVDGKKLKVGDGIAGYNSLTYFGGSGGSGESNTISVTGDGNGIIYKEKVGVDLVLKSIKAGAGITITNNTDDITISSGAGASTTDDVFEVKNAVDNTKVMEFDISGVTTATTRTITMADFDLTLGVSNGDNTFTQITTPSNPSAGSNKLYFKSDDLLYQLDSAGNETLVGGSSNKNVVTKVAGYTATTDDDVILCNGTFTVDLFASSGNSGKELVIKNIGTGTITIDANSTETIDGDLTQVITVQYDSVKIICDGSNWYII